MSRAWYIVKGIDNNQNTVEFDFFGDPNLTETLKLAREIAQNKLHTAEDVVLQFNMM